MVATSKWFITERHYENLLLTGLYVASIPAKKTICASPMATTRFLWIEVRSEASVLKMNRMPLISLHGIETMGKEIEAKNSNEMIEIHGFPA